MTPALLIKRELKRTAGTAAVLSARLGLGATPPFACVLMYHRITAATWAASPVDNWNVSPDQFDRQMTALASSCECVPLTELPRRVPLWKRGDRPLVCLTFDDGFAGVATHALPVLVRLGLPATVFVVTSCIGADGPMPFDLWGQYAVGHVPSHAWSAMDWRHLQDLAASGLVTIGSHSHWHRDGRRMSSVDFGDEAVRSREILRSRLGAEHANTYAYPYGSVRLGHVSQGYVDAVRGAGYTTAVSTELGVVTPASDPFLLPRVEANGVDSAAMILAKAAGALMPFAVTDRFRHASRGA
jgi:peptidoglycan/xylan/chitin deacetylase (PgdA/CDA1 family)